MPWPVRRENKVLAEGKIVCKCMLTSARMKCRIEDGGRRMEDGG